MAQRDGLVALRVMSPLPWAFLYWQARGLLQHLCAHSPVSVFPDRQNMTEQLPRDLCVADNMNISIANQKAQQRNNRDANVVGDLLIKCIKNPGAGICLVAGGLLLSGGQQFFKKTIKFECFFF